MSDSTKAAKADIDVDELIAQSDTGARHPAGITGKMVMAIAFIWSCFQLYIASSVPFWLSQTFGINFVFNNTESRIVHLAFAIALASFAYPLFNKSPRDRIPYYDYLLAILGVGSCLYLLVFKEDIANRAGLPTSGDLIASTIGLAALALSVYRALGLPMLCVAAVFMVYVFFGHMEFLPDVIQWKGATYSKALWHYWMQTEGVFGVALGVSASMIFLFVLFGALLEKAGAGGYFIKLAFALLGHMRGGPAKAAVVASALSGLYSGSSIANVVTTGTFTIPLMKRTGFPAEKAGAVEVASSVNGQLTPPVMGAAAFLITEFVGISYTELIKNAALPALISYIALVYIVHLEALKMGLEGMEKPSPTASLARRALGFLSGFIGIALLGLAVYYGLGWIKHVLPGATAWTASGVFLIAYLALVSIAARHPDLDDDPNAPIEELPRAGEVAVTGLHYLLPIIVLLWCILVEKLSPALSAFWATLGMVFIVLTQHTIKGILRGETDIVGDIRRGIGDFCEGMIGGARNMIAIGVATGVAGVIIGSISLTGAHQIVGEFVEYVSGGNLMIMLILVAVMSLILGMGLPTTANYIVVSSLMAPVIVSVGAQSGLIVPLVAVHLFVFYFGILADDTPPVGLAAFAAAAISGGDPIKTGIQGFGYDIRTALLPFMFIFNTEILLIDVSPMKAVVVFVVAVIAMLLFAAGTQGYFFVRNRIWETAALLLIAFTLFRPGFWLDMVENPYVSIPPAQAFQTIEAQPDGKPLRMVFTGPDYQKPDQMDELTLMVDPGAKGPSGQERMSKLGLDFTEQDGKLVMEEPFGPPYLQKFRDFDFYGDTPVELARIEMPAERMAKEVFYIPAALLLGLVMLLQWMRLKKQKAAA